MFKWVSMENKQKKVTPQEMEDRLIEFASRIIDMVEALPKTAAAKHPGNQVLRSGTSPALNMVKRKRLNHEAILYIK